MHLMEGSGAVCDIWDVYFEGMRFLFMSEVQKVDLNLLTFLILIFLAR